ncbi:hypothetical protein AB0F46_21890 [Streptomyces sp. NPDC026665]|uniref:hypothetical protein n=1 Tax=Streptomyces sp. NPDC026665 TaxID=3154798 RepID=UPI00340877C2
MDGPASAGLRGLPQRVPAPGLGRVGRDLFQYFTTGRTSLWDLAVWHAAARTEEVVVVRRARSGGEPWHYARGRAESAPAFAARVRALERPERRSPAGDADAPAAGEATKRHVLLALVHGGVAPEGASGSVYRLLPGPVDGCGPTRLTAGDLVAALG